MRFAIHILSLIMLLSLTACTWTQAPAPAVYYGAKQGPGSRGMHNVNPGDTLYSLSQRYNIDMQDIVYANSLTPPFKLQVGQRVVLPPPRIYKVRAGDTLHGVSRIFDVSPWEIARQNDLQPPYIINAGQQLNLPSARRTQKTSAENRSPTTMDVSRIEPVDAEPLSSDSSSVTPKEKPNATSTKNVITPKSRSKPLKTNRLNIPKRSSSKFAEPVKGRIISSYGAKASGLHNDGINIAAKRGASVNAAENGIVVYADNKLRGSGNLVLVRHDQGWMTAYAHLDKINVRKGQTLKRGQTLGTVGSTGAVDKPQLHFEIRKGTHALNPQKYME